MDRVLITGALGQLGTSLQKALNKKGDFVIATVAAPTIVKEPEKPVEETAEGAEAAAEGEAPKEGDQTDASEDAKKPDADKDKKEAAPEKK